jgi:predicted enzyme related to lactoylglutathione lyase/uncharacterized protein YndB with AHSA1/START domain
MQEEKTSFEITSPNTMVLRRFIKAPRERIWAALTNAEEVKKWFGPETSEAISVKLDARPGGRFEVRIRSQEIPEMEGRGIFREVTEPSRLAYTWKWSGHPDMQFGDTLVTVDLHDVDGGTDLQIIHEALPNPEMRDDHYYGWNGSLDKLVKLLGVQECRGAMYGSFCWNELMTSDVAGAATFYKNLLGWNTADFPGDGVQYKIWKKRDKELGGLMATPMPEVPTQWLPYVFVEDADAIAQKAASLGGKVCAEPRDIPTVGRIAVLQDPQGATFGLIKPFPKEK